MGGGGGGGSGRSPPHGIEARVGAPLGGRPKK